MRWQPSSLDLATALAEHAGHRGAVLATDALLRFRYGKALTSRRYDRLWQRMGNRLPGVAVQGIFTHWLRHTTLTWGRTHFGYGIARAYAGHTDTTARSLSGHVAHGRCGRAEFAQGRAGTTTIPASLARLAGQAGADLRSEGWAPIESAARSYHLASRGYGRNRGVRRWSSSASQPGSPIR
jgi:hypothetical protein